MLVTRLLRGSPTAIKHGGIRVVHSPQEAIRTIRAARKPDLEGVVPGGETIPIRGGRKSTRSCARGALRRPLTDMLCLLAFQLLSAKSRAYLLLPAVLASHCPLNSGLLSARPTHALQTYCVCLLFEFYWLNQARIAVACSSGFPLPASSRLLLARPTQHALRCSF